MELSNCTIQLDDVQGHVIRGAKVAASKFYFLAITEPKVFADFLKSSGFRDLLVNEREIRGRAGAFSNIAFSFAGLQALGLPETLLAQFPPAFKEGMAQRSAFIGDGEVDGPDHWEGYMGTPLMHAVISMHWVPEVNLSPKKVMSWSPKERELHWQAIDEVWATLVDNASQSPPGSRCLAREEAHVIRKNGQIKEHFGFTDGISQPYINDGTGGRKGGGKKVSTGAPWQPLAAGEFLLGYCDELHRQNGQAGSDLDQDTLLPVPKCPVAQAFSELTLNGTYMVYRKLEQDVESFRAYCSEHGEELAAKLVGRKYDGTPMASACAQSDYNEFDFSDDDEGEKCPFASHIRRSNPRLSLSKGPGDGTRLVDQHRIIRRGMPYGDYIDPDDDNQQKQENHSPRGLHFICYNARIDSQFEFIQKHWLSSSDFLSFSSPVIDPICGSRQHDKLGMFVVNKKQAPVFGLQQYVYVKGGEYFFTPGINGTALIASLANTIDPVLTSKQHIQPFDPASSDPLSIDEYIEAERLMTGKGFVKLRTKDEAGEERFYYYFAKPQDVDAILAAPSLFTNDLYRKRIMALTDADMLLSRPITPDRQVLKKHIGGFLQPADFKGYFKKLLEPELARISQQFQQSKSIDLVADLARRLPLTIVKEFYGVKGLDFGEKPYSLTQVAYHFGRTEFASLPSQWQHSYEDYKFSSDEDQTLLFWIRALFLEVFTNQYGVEFLQKLARNSAQEFAQKLNQLIKANLEQASSKNTLLCQLVTMYQKEYGFSGARLIDSVRQSLLEIIVGSTDTTAKAISSVVCCLLEAGFDLRSGLVRWLGNDEPRKYVLKRWLGGDRSVENEAMLDEILDLVIINCLRKKPVAPIIPRYCTHGAQYTTAAEEVLDIEPGAVVFLVTEVTLGAALRYKVPPSDERFIFTDSSPHACMGKHIATLEIREALKMLLAFDQVRPAAGPNGKFQEKYRLPVAMTLRCN